VEPNLLLSALVGVEPVNWSESRLRSQPECPVRWLPIADLSGRFVGLISTGEWAADTVEGLVVLSTPNSTMPLLPCLGSSYVENHGILADACTALGLPGGVADTFPWPPLVLNAIESESDHWVRLALNWLEVVPPEQLPPDALSRIANSKQFSQETRHLARRLARR
jgi:hypothetical protein